MRYFISIIILLGFLLSGCSEGDRTLLKQIDAVMEDNPDSALTLLSDIDRSSLKDSELPYYALLMTQAMVKTDVPVDSDSLISIAYAKYGADTDGDLGIRSNFYTGEVLFNKENYRDAMRYYLKAYEESKRLRNDYWRAKAIERISDIYFFIYNYDDAAMYAQEAADYYKKASRTRNHRFAIGQLARILVNNGSPDRAYVLLDSLKTLALNQNPVDSMLLYYVKLPMVNAMMQTGRLNKEEIDSFDFFTDDMSELEILDATILQSQVHNAIDSPCEVKESLNDAVALAHTDEDKIHILYARYENAKARGDSSLALSLVDSMLFYQNKVAEDIIHESVTGAQRDFYSDMALDHNRRALFLKRFLWVVVICSLMLLSLIIAVSYLRLKAQKVKLDNNMESLLSMKAYSDKLLDEKHSLEKSMFENKSLMLNLDRRYEESKKDVESLRKTISDQDDIVGKLEVMLKDNKQREFQHAEVIEKLFKEKWTTLDTLCNQYFGLDNSELTAKTLVSNIEKELKKIVSDKGLADIVEATDKYMGGIVSNLRNQCPFFKDNDIGFIALLFAGLSVRSVCMFTGIKYQHFYVKKSRLIKRIQSSDAPDKDLFLEKLK